MPRDAQKVRTAQLENGPRDHDRHVHDMLRTSILSIHCHGCIVMFQERRVQFIFKMLWFRWARWGRVWDPL
eukprot:288208-Pelagomonas_calceolata.AAC.11